MTARAAALLLLIFGFLPIVNWIRGGHEADWYSLVLSEWLSGSAIVVGAAVVLVILSRRVPQLWRDGVWTGWALRWKEAGWRADVALALGALAVYAVVATLALSRKPLLIDEIVQVFQARILAQGKLWLPAPAYPEFFSSMHVIDAGGKVFGQFPIGGPAMLLPGTWLGAEWMVGPSFGAVSVLLFARLVRRIEPRPGAAFAAALLFPFAPFVAFMAGSHMNHVPTLTWLLVAMLGLAHLTQSEGADARAAIAVGLGLGVAATIRPVDGLAFALPAGAWLLARTVRVPQRWTELVAAGVALSLPLAVMFWVNAQQTGHPLLFGYTVLWGKSHDLGFHSAPWGEVHSPLRGLELLNLYALRLQTYLFEAPVPSLLWATVGLLAARRLDRMDRYLLVSGGLLAALYFAYWHDGFFLGPRFMYPLAPLLVLWSARAVPLLRERGVSPRVWRGAVYASLLAAPLAVLTGVPIRWRQYAAGFTKIRWDVDAEAERAGVRDALIFVRESWGSQVVARLWAAGIPRTEGEMYYRRVDTCRLDQALDALDRMRVSGDSARALLQPLLADSARLIASPYSPDFTERIDTTLNYPLRCRQRIAEDRLGFMVFPPLLLAGANGNVFARDLHARDALLLAQYPGRPLYLLRPATTAASTRTIIEKLSPDSVRAEWSSAAQHSP